LEIEMPGVKASLPWKRSKRDDKSMDGMVVVMDRENRVVEKYIFENARCRGNVTISDGNALTKYTITAEKFVIENQSSSYIYN
jgi:hypothetical protein